MLKGIDMQVRNILVMAGMVLAAYYLYKWVKRKEAERNMPPDGQSPDDLPSNPIFGSQTAPNQSVNFDPTSITNALKDDIYSYGFRNVEIYKRVAALSNVELVAVYNDYKNRYFHLDQETMVMAMKNESYDAGWGLAWWREPLRPIVDGIINRLAGLGLH